MADDHPDDDDRRQNSLRLPEPMVPPAMAMKANLVALQSPPSSTSSSHTTEPPQSFLLPTSIQTTTTPATNPFFEHESPLGASAALLLHSRSPLSTGSLRRDRNRTTRRSTDVLQHLKALDGEHRSRGYEAVAPRETKNVAITTDDVGDLKGVNQYAIIKELGKGAFAEVKLCKRQVGGTPGSPEAASTPGGMMGSGDYATITSGAGSPKGQHRPTTPSPTPVGDTAAAAGGSPTPATPTSSSLQPQEELFAIKIFSKSLLLRRKNFQRGAKGRLNVTTDLEKVQQEIAIMKKLVHPHLVSLYEVIDDASQDALYLVLEYVPGGAIMTYDAEEKRYVYPRTKDGTMGEIQAAKVLTDMLAGLVYLHMHHIAHRDLKPENVLMDQHGRCKIADFGVAHYFEEEEARVAAETTAAATGPPGEQHLLHHLYRSYSRGLLSKSDGTWCFWAPEMCKQGASFSGYSCDVWAAGVCLWTFVYGTLPFQEDSPDELFEAIVEKEPVFPDERKPVSPELHDLLGQFLYKVPTARITVGDALDHPWSQLADMEEGGGGGEEDQASVPLVPPSPGMHSSLRSRAYSFQKVHVTSDEINGAIQSVNNFILINKLKKRLTRKLKEARASLNRIYSPAVSPDASPSTSPDHSRSSSPVPPPAQPQATAENERQQRSSYSFLPPAIFPSQHHRKTTSGVGTSLSKSKSGSASPSSARSSLFSRPSEAGDELSSIATGTTSVPSKVQEEEEEGKVVDARAPAAPVASPPAPTDGRRSPGFGPSRRLPAPMRATHKSKGKESCSVM